MKDNDIKEHQRIKQMWRNDVSYFVSMLGFNSIKTVVWFEFMQMMISN